MNNREKLNELLALEHPSVPAHRHVARSLAGLTWCRKNVREGSDLLLSLLHLPNHKLHEPYQESA
jgi:hypothetical protein